LVKIEEVELGKMSSNYFGKSKENHNSKNTKTQRKSGLVVIIHFGELSGNLVFNFLFSKHYSTKETTLS
jgi:hypothetical protein